MPTLVGLGFAGVFGPTRGQVAGVGYSLPLEFVGGHPPHPRQGAPPPCTPICPPPLAEGSPAFWAPLVGGLLMRATRSLFWFYGGAPPRPPARGLAPPGPPFCPPPLALGLPGFWAPLVAGLLMWTTRPLFWFRGGTPPITPRHGGFAPLDPPICSPSWAGARGLGQRAHPP